MNRLEKAARLDRIVLDCIVKTPGTIQEIASLVNQQQDKVQRSVTRLSRKELIKKSNIRRGHASVYVLAAKREKLEAQESVAESPVDLTGPLSGEELRRAFRLIVSLVDRALVEKDSFEKRVLALINKR